MADGLDSAVTALRESTEFESLRIKCPFNRKKAESVPIYPDALQPPAGDRAMNTDVARVPAMERLQVLGTIETGLYDFDSSLAYLHLIQVLG